MKFSISSFLLLFTFSFFSFETKIQFRSNDPLLVVVLMVKDEEPVIVKTLTSYLGSRDVGFFIFDTGSTDNTMGVVREFFKKNNITHGDIAQEQFVDFATSRNRALELAKKRFPRASFLLMPDAEWYLHNLKDLVAFCRQKSTAKTPAYLMRIGNNSIDFWTPRLIRCKSSVKFVGVVHEVLDHCTQEKVPSNVRFELGGSRYGAEKSYKRWKRDANLLLKKFEENPQDPRAAFYLAQTYDCLGDLENAYKYYEIRTKLAGWDEENFMAFYRLAQVAERRGVAEKNNNYWWPIALDYYLKAYALRPHRVEPLIKISQHYYYEQSQPLVYLFARPACEVPYPEKDSLFVEKNLYDFDRHDLVGIAAWYVNKFEVGEDAVRKAIQARPEMPHLYRNLANYIQRRQKVNT